MHDIAACSALRSSRLTQKFLTTFAALAFGICSLISEVNADDTKPTDDKSKPSVLICAWGSFVNFDLNYTKRLQDAGFTVDFSDGWQDVTWERISKFDAIVIFNLPDRGKVERSPGGGPASGLPQEKFLKVLDRYMEAGGGVFINLEQISYYAPGQYGNQAAGLAQFGAKLPAEGVIAPASDIAALPRLAGQEFFYTSNILPSPVSEGVKGLWMPVGSMAGHFRPLSGTIEVDSNWQVVVKAPKGSVSKPFDISGASESLREKNVYFRESVAEPDLFAIRSYKKGRMALFYCDSIPHIGSGTKWYFDGIMLDKGTARRPSDFGRLFENTLRWLAEPAMKIGKLGGAQLAADRLVPGAMKPGAKDHNDAIRKGSRRSTANLQEFASALPVFKGFVGARTTLSGGNSTVAEYAHAAHEKDLGFVIILEDGSQMTAEKIDTLKKECTAASDDNLLVLPGFRLPTNLGVSFFVYGENPTLPPAEMQSKRVPGSIVLQGETSDGKWTMDAKFLEYVFMNWTKNDHGGSPWVNVGFYDFKKSVEVGAFFKPEYARVSGALGVKFYKDGKLVEDLTPEYLRVNAGSMPVDPMAVNLVDSATEMSASIARGDALNYAQAPKASKLLEAALYWVSLGGNGAPPTFMSNGPIVENWPEMFTPAVYGAEDFVYDATWYASELRVHSNVGLKEVAIYDGEKLFRRILPGGAIELKEKLILTSQEQRILSVVATDVNGGQALVSPRRPGGKVAAAFCPDHVNASIFMARGVFWPSVLYPVATIPDPGSGWDGGPTPTVNLWTLIPGAYFNCQFADGAREGGMPFQYPVVSCADSQVGRYTSVAAGTLDMSNAGPWTAWGPVAPRTLFDATASIAMFYQYSIGIDPAGWSPCLVGGSEGSLFDETFTFKRDGVVKELKIDGGANYNKNRGTLLCGIGDQMLEAFDLMPGNGPRNTSMKLPVGGWFAVVSADGANAMLTFNRGVPLRLFTSDVEHYLAVDLPEAGLPVKKGQQIKTELSTIHWPLNLPIQSGTEMLRVVKYLNAMEKMTLPAGKITSSSAGLLDVLAANYQMEIALAQPPQSGPDKVQDTTVPMRVSGLNPRWSAGLFQIKGYNGGNYYSDGSNRYRPLGIDEQGRVYTPLVTAKVPETHVRVGNPVVADGRGKDLFIQVTPLTDPTPSTEPRWHLSVNNPTDQAITTVLKNNMQLPGMKFIEQEVALKPGEYKILEHGESQAKIAATPN